MSNIPSGKEAEESFQVKESEGSLHVRVEPGPAETANVSTCRSFDLPELDISIDNSSRVYPSELLGCAGHSVSNRFARILGTAEDYDFSFKLLADKQLLSISQSGVVLQRVRIPAGHSILEKGSASQQSGSAAEGGKKIRITMQH